MCKKLFMINVLDHQPKLLTSIYLLISNNTVKPNNNKVCLWHEPQFHIDQQKLNDILLISYSLRFTKYTINTPINRTFMYRTSIRNIEKDKQKAYPVYSSSKQYNWISARSVASFTKNTKQKASYGKTARTCITLRQTVN